jgi:sensor domain CHASE-containing protein
VSLGWKLFLVFLGFLAILATVIVASFRARKRARELGDDIEAQQEEDARVMAIIFSSIVGGMALTLITAWLVFF